MRIDKFLKNSRLIKRRTVAKDACDQGRVSVNGKPAKAGTEVKVGDIIHIEFGNSSVSARILEISESCKKEAATKMYEIMQEKRPQVLFYFYRRYGRFCGDTADFAEILLPRNLKNIAPADLIV